VEIRELAEADRDDVVRIRALAFGPSSSPPPKPLVVPGAAGLVAEVDGRVAAVLAVRHTAQHFGGRSVPMGGVAGVAVDAHARGRGVASALLDTALRDMRERGQCLSALYATAPPLYRAFGWERAGLLETVTLPLDRLLLSPRPERRARTGRATADDVADARAAYTALARTVDGTLDRDTLGAPTPDLLEQHVATVVRDDDGVLTGYLAADRESERLHVHDLVAATPDAQLALLRELTSWAGVLDRVAVRVVDPAFTGLITAQAMRYETRTSTWMLRVVDLDAALAARGWPAASALRDLTVDLDVIDEHAPWNAGRRRLVLRDGVVRAEPGGTGAVRLHARALGPWYSGMQNTHALRRAGLLEGDPADAAPLDLLVGVPGTPRMADFF
jgi:predicted acetyltransferase